MQRLILFDVDGTLLRAGRQVRPIFTEALAETFGADVPLDGVDFAGKTDPMIVTELLRRAGLDAEAARERLPTMRRSYLRRMRERLDGGAMRVLPGVVDLLRRLSARDDLVVGLLTGNWRGGADVKLERCGLGGVDGGFFVMGAFGDDADDRRGLVPVALERGSALCGRQLDSGDALIIGDTALDVDCARHAGVACLGVATGWTPRETLEAAGADFVFDTLEHAAREHPWLR
ncbi:MAG: HAD family hydrolase [Acidobacteriota bacterium]